MAKQTLHTNLLGTFLIPTAAVLKLDKECRRLVSSKWPLDPSDGKDAPSLRPLYYGEIVAAYLEENSIRFVVRGPTGELNKVWFHEGLFLSSPTRVGAIHLAEEQAAKL